VVGHLVHHGDHAVCGAARGIEHPALEQRCMGGFPVGLSAAAQGRFAGGARAAHRACRITTLNIAPPSPAGLRVPWRLSRKPTSSGFRSGSSQPRSAPAPTAPLRAAVAHRPRGGVRRKLPAVRERFVEPSPARGAGDVHSPMRPEPRLELSTPREVCATASMPGGIRGALPLLARSASEPVVQPWLLLVGCDSGRSRGLGESSTLTAIARDSAPRGEP
jgi:hypothetical protein